ncbi:MAG: polymer-forming cytoskeletal protein [Tepidanaerobacteraceae bacterium]|jgi:hypothetical protein|nr:polymer-forming cytoskeletal protein [Tepidanaerobacteraceae bacterium]
MRKTTAFILIILLFIPAIALAQSVDYRFQIGGDIIIDSHETIKGDVVTVLGDITVDGKVSGDVVAILGNVRVNGEVTGDVTSVGGTIIRGETSKIYGKSTEIGVSGIKGLVNGIKRPGIHLDPGIFARNIRYSFFKVVRFLGLLAVGILVIILFPNAVKNASNLVEEEIGKKLLIGLAIFLLIPVAVILLFITLIGIPLIPIFLILLYAAGFFGYLCISIYIGRKLNERIIKKPEVLLEFVLGALILWLVQLVPFIGSLTSLAALIISLGIAADTRFGSKAGE